MSAITFALKNAAQLARTVAPATESKIGSWMGPDMDFISENHTSVSGSDQQWRPESFWIPRRVALGFPLVVVSHRETAQGWLDYLEQHNVRASISSTSDEALSGLFDSVQVLYGQEHTGFTYFSDVRLHTNFTQWLVQPYTIGDIHADAYARYVTMPLAVSEDVMGVLGPNIWHDFDALVTDLVEPTPVDPLTWRVFWRLISLGRNNEALSVGDIGATSDANGGRSPPLWHREKDHKRRHYFDIASLLIATTREWTSHGHGPLFTRTAMDLLNACCESRMNYERTYLTLFWVCCSPYWADISRVLLVKRLLYLPDTQWRLAFEEATAQIKRSWFIPNTNHQSMVAAYFLNAEDLVGFPSANPNTGAFSLDILSYALDEYDYASSVPEDQTFISYLEQFSRATETLLEPIYQQFSEKVTSSKDHGSKEYLALGAGCISGRRAREKLEQETSSKGNKCGASKLVSATDMCDQLAEQIAFGPINNRFPVLGLDIGDSPSQAMDRHLNLLADSEGPAHTQGARETLMCWDWRAWDYYVHCVERRLVLDAMKKLTERYIQEPIRHDILQEIVSLQAETDRPILRSQAFFDEKYGLQVDEMIMASGGRAERLADHTGSFAVSVQHPNNQQSARMSTLSDKNIASTSRLTVRESELIPRSADVGHRTSMFMCNCADNVTQVFSSMKRAEAAVATMLRQEHEANHDNQVTQGESTAHPRNPYANGSMCAFPVRATYAAATDHTDKVIGAEVYNMDQLRSLSKGLDLYARRGGLMTLARRLYDDAAAYYSRIRVPHQTPRGIIRSSKITISPEVIAAPVEQGGFGILPPGEYE